MIPSVRKEFEAMNLDHLPKYLVEFYKDAASKKVNCEKVKHVIAVITLRREGMHMNKTGLPYRTVNGMTGIPFDRPTIIPSVEFNRLVMKKDVVAASEENPYRFKTTVTATIDHNDRLCDPDGNTTYEVGNSIEAEVLKLIREGRYDEVAKIMGQNAGDKADEKKDDYEVREEDGKFKVFKVGGDKSLKNFTSLKDAESYIESMNM